MSRAFSAGEAGLAFFLGCVVASGSVQAIVAETAPSARMSRVLKDVKLSAAGNSPRPVKAGDAVPDGTTLQTGAEARAEVMLPGPAITRLGGRTTLTLASNGALELGEGLVLFQVPRSGTTKITTGTINLEVRGSTGLIERNGGAYVKILILEGDARVYTSRLGESIVMTAGQLLITTPKALGLAEPVHFNIEHLYQTSLLINAGFAPLASRDLILRAIAEQKSDPQFVPTNLVIFGRGTLVNLIPPSKTPAQQPKRP